MSREDEWMSTNPTEEGAVDIMKTQRVLLSGGPWMDTMEAEGTVVTLIKAKVSGSVVNVADFLSHDMQTKTMVLEVVVHATGGNDKKVEVVVEKDSRILSVKSTLRRR